MEKLPQVAILVQQVQFLNGFSTIKVSTTVLEVLSIRLTTQTEEQEVLLSPRSVLLQDSTGSLESSMSMIQ